MFGMALCSVGSSSLPLWAGFAAGVIDDHSRELGDDAHSVANTTQALRLWQESGLEEAAFVAQLHAAKKRTRHYQAGGIGNKMAYYFQVLRDLLAREGSA